MNKDSTKTASGVTHNGGDVRQVCFQRVEVHGFTLNIVMGEDQPLIGWLQLVTMWCMHAELDQGSHGFF